jgi:polysaccharide biosynthesis protein PslG
MGVRLALSAAVLALLLPSAAAARSVPQNFYGMVYDGAVTRAPASVQDAQFAQMARSGVESVRTVFSWAAAQPVQDGPIDFSATDQLVALAARHGMSLLPIVIGTPEWARLDPSSGASPPADPNAYARYLTALAERYGSSGSFWAEHPELPHRPLLYWQIWNEPHLRLYWDAAHWQKGYGKLLRVAHAALRQADPRSRVVLAGLTGTSWTALQSLYSRGRVKGSFDVAALQTYTGTAQHELLAVQLIRGVLARHGAARMPLWLTEMGWPAAQGRMRVPSYQRNIATTDAGMRRRLTAGYDILIRNRRSHRALVSRVYWYTWSSPYTRSSDLGTGIFRFGGLLRFNGSTFTRKPALAAYVRSARKHEGCVKTSTGVCR